MYRIYENALRTMVQRRHLHGWRKGEHVIGGRFHNTDAIVQWIVARLWTRGYGIGRRAGVHEALAIGKAAIR